MKLLTIQQKIEHRRATVKKYRDSHRKAFCAYQREYYRTHEKRREQVKMYGIKFRSKHENVDG